MRGPLPDENRARRNAPTIPTTKIPAGGRRGAIPKLPAWLGLGKVGAAWWAWAWRTPQACAWDDGQLVKVAHRAQLEDDMAAIADFDTEGLGVDILNAADLREVKAILGRLSALATGKMSIIAKINDLDDKLGLSPKGRDQLRLKVVADSEYYPPAAPRATKKAAATKVSNIADRRRRVAGDAS